jgi:hypothetical protein
MENKMEYTVRSTHNISGTDARLPSTVWEKAETLNITHFPWPDSGHRPETMVKLLYTPEALYIRFQVKDQFVRAVAKQFQDSVCTDSCVEFFVAPVSNSLSYFNFEVNCGGTMLLHRCPSIEERAKGRETENVTDADGATIVVDHSLPSIVDPELVEPTNWTIEYRVPFLLFEKYFEIDPPGPGDLWRGNFYKCGDKTSRPHWGSWAPVETERPNFHTPQFFRPIVFA